MVMVLVMVITLAVMVMIMVMVKVITYGHGHGHGHSHSVTSADDDRKDAHPHHPDEADAYECNSKPPTPILLTFSVRHLKTGESQR